MNARNKILIVDDDPVSLNFFQLMLSKLGYAVEEAADGLDALEKVRSFRPDLILLDNIMPKMSGWELTTKLKEDGEYRNIPIIMFSALDDVKDKVAGFELGVDDYITKPFNFSEVLARIKAMLRTRELFAQIAARESRLGLAEDMSRDMRRNLSDLTAAIDELEEELEALLSAAPSESADGARACAKRIRALAEDLDARLGKTLVEWEDLKKNEIGLSALESENLNFSGEESDGNV